VKWYTDIIETIDFFLRKLGEGLPRAISVLLRLGLLWMFFCYLCGFSQLLWSWSGLFVVLLWSVILLLLGWRIIRIACEFDLDKAPESSGLPAYFYLNLFPIAAVAFLEWWGYKFPTAGALYYTHLLLSRLLGRP
jgi:hypothetical protein